MTSPAASGPAGPHFEGQVGAYYLLALLAGAEARGLPGCTIEQVCLQGATSGYSLDDVIVHAHEPSGQASTIEIQVKRHISLAPSDEAFAAVMKQVATAVVQPGFWASRTELAVATAHHSAQIDGPYQDVLTWARELGDAASFHHRFSLSSVASESMRTFVSTFRSHLQANGAPADDQTVWALLRRFHILVFDFTALSSADEDLAKERTVRILPPGEEQRASEFWRLLVERSMAIAKSGGDRTREQLQSEFTDGFRFAPLRRHQESLARLGEFSRQALEDIETRVAGVRLSRQKYVNQMWECLQKGRYIDIRGDAGVGKSGILRHFAEQLSSQSRIVVLSPDRTPLRGWAGMRHELDFHGTCRELLMELRANGGNAIFIDNLDFFRSEERAAVIDLLREAVSIPGMVVVTTGRRTSDVERTWLPQNLLDQLGRTPVISVENIDTEDRAELRSCAPQLLPLLDPTHSAHDVLSNLFRLSQLAQRPGSDAIPRTEAEMATVWWRTGGSYETEGRRERSRLLKELASHAFTAARSYDSSSWSPTPVDSLVRDETLLELKPDTVTFRHDVLREWAMACLLFAEPDRLSGLPLDIAAPADMARAVELLARMRIENASDATEWLKLLVVLSGANVHSSWRRSGLLALVRSEAGIEVLNTLAPVLIHDKGAILCELIRLVLAVEVVPARSRFVAAGLDATNVPASITVPAGLSWVRLMAWIAFRLGKQLPPEAIPDVVKMYTGWCMSLKGGDPFSPTLVTQIYGWLREIEEAKEVHPHWSNPGVFSGAIQGDQLNSLEDTLRLHFVAFAFHVPHLAAEYLKTFEKRTYSEHIRIEILKFRGSLAQAAPAALANFTFRTLIPTGARKKRESSVMRDGPFGYTDGQFLPCSPSQGPFFELLTHSPVDGLRLIRRLVDYSISFFANSQEPQRDGITIQLADGPRFFPWIRTYMWSREAYGGPYLVTSGLMALEAWAHLRLDKGEPFDDVLRDVLGEPGAPVAYLLPVVDLVLSHWEQAVTGAVPFAGSPELLALDRGRLVRDNMPELPKIPILQELEELHKEPVGNVSTKDLKKRNSRNFMLDQVLGNYAFLTDTPEPLEKVRGLLSAAATRLEPPAPSHGLYDPEFMVLHALNKLAPQNYSMMEVPLKGGGATKVPWYVPTALEEAQFAGLERPDRAKQQSAQAMRNALVAAVQDPKLSTEPFLRGALAFIDGSEESPQPEEERWPGSIPHLMEDSIKLALLIARDGSPELRQERADWLRKTLALGFSEEQRDAHRYRSEVQFNPQAFSFVGYVCLLKHEWNSENIRLLLGAASFRNPQASIGMKAAAQDLDALDKRLVRSVLRSAFTAQIRPGREWQVSEEERAQQITKCADDVAARIEAETEWLLDRGDEPSWPTFPQERPSLRNSHRHRATDPRHLEEEPTIEQLDFSEHGAAEWLDAIESLFDPTTRPWLRDLMGAYKTWTNIANGAGVEKDEQIDGTPEAWNKVYFRLVASCLRGSSLKEVGEMLSSHFGEMPDEPLCENLEIFLKASDLLFFNENAFSAEVAVQVRTLAGSLLQATRSWKWLQQDRTDRAVRHTADVVSTYYFNEPSNMFSRSKCYLKPVAIPRIPPFLAPLQTLALDCPSPVLGGVALNLIEVSPSPEHLPFLISVALSWASIYQEEVRFWIEYQFGKRLAYLFEVLLASGIQGLTANEVKSLDWLLGFLVKLGIPEALRAEDLLRVWIGQDNEKADTNP